VEEAIEDAKRNAKRNNIEGIDFYAADVGKFLKEYPNFSGKIKTIILDPPRAGIAPKTLLKVIELEAENIVYISCNPSTQARDTYSLIQAGYILEKISLVDQFPHTGHIESIAKYKRK
jgi:tRNA/tmRNA/rRNA uracil-C5-methylase (TrmA/RlmC/RlmD family)